MNLFSDFRRDDLLVPANWEIHQASMGSPVLFQYAATIEVPEEHRKTISDALSFLWAATQNRGEERGWLDTAPWSSYCEAAGGTFEGRFMGFRSTMVGDVFKPVESNVAFVVKSLGFETFVICK